MNATVDHVPRDVFTDERPHRCERLARITGQTNYWMVAGGGEIGTDTTEDMAALAMARGRGCLVEALEARWGGAACHRYALAQAVWESLHRQRAKLRAGEDRNARAGILDGIDQFIGLPSRNAPAWARRAHNVCTAAYVEFQKATLGLLHAWAGDAAPEWIHARFASW